MPISSDHPLYSPVAGNAIEASWGVAVSLSIEQRFSTAAERDVLWTSPSDLSLCWTLDTNTQWIYLAGSWRSFIDINVTGAPGSEVISVSGLVVESGTPAGSIQMFAGAVAPTGWLVMNGAAIAAANTTYPSLWAVAPASWKSGTTLTLPNMANRVPTGLGSTALGSLGGANSRSIAVGNMPAHLHDMIHAHTASAQDDSHNHATNLADGFDIHSGNQAGATNAVFTVGGAAVSFITRPTAALQTDVGGVAQSTGGDTHTHAITVDPAVMNTGLMGGGAPLDTTPAHLAVTFIIKAH